MHCSQRSPVPSPGQEHLRGGERGGPVSHKHSTEHTRRRGPSQGQWMGHNAPNTQEGQAQSAWGARNTDIAGRPSPGSALVHSSIMLLVRYSPLFSWRASH